MRHEGFEPDLGASERGEEPRILEFEFLRDQIMDGQRTILELWDDETGTFWRDTRQREREGSPSGFYPTVSFRCLGSLLELCTVSKNLAASETIEVLESEIIPKFRDRGIEDLKQSTLGLSGQNNLFTLSVFLQSLGRLSRVRLADSEHSEIATEKLREGLSELVGHEKVQDSDMKLHPFLAYHIHRAIKLGAPFVSTPALQDGLHQLSNRVYDHSHDAILGSLAKKQVGSIDPGDAIALAFSSAIVANGKALALSGPEHSPTEGEDGVTGSDLERVVACLEVCIEEQDPATGSWPFGRVILSEDKDLSRDLTIPTFEVTDAVATGAIQVLRSAIRNDVKVPDAFVSQITEGMLASANYIERSAVHLSGTARPGKGWCSDHPYGKSIIESWTTATVVEAILRLQSFAREFNRDQILSSFTTMSPTERSWPSWLRWSSFRESGEVDHDNPILSYLEEEMIDPVRNAPEGPRSGQDRSVSALLFGPPGTGKTSMVKGVADALGWPVVTLTPGNFIEKGLEYIEEQAQSVFGRLMHLSNAVILFDECDELFRDRTPREETEQTRGITAFVTASMLPKIQDLHDRGDVLFFVCTNNFRALDSAIKREGRIDHIIGVGPPDKEARDKIAQEILENRDLPEKGDDNPHLKAAIDEIVAESSRFTRSELARAVRDILDIAHDQTWTKDDEARKVARSLVKEREKSLTITTETYEQFKEDRRKFSHPHSEGE